MLRDPIEKFLDRLRDSNPDIERIYTQGGCFELYLILRTIWPEAKCWYVMLEGHVYTQIGKAYYDIRGKHTKLGSSAIELAKEEPRIFHKAFRWKRHAVNFNNATEIMPNKTQMLANWFLEKLEKFILKKPSYWRGDTESNPCFVSRKLFTFWHYTFTLHGFVSPDDKYFHSHPYVARRWVLVGGYVEHLLDIGYDEYFPDQFEAEILEETISTLHTSKVFPYTIHRIDRLLKPQDYKGWMSCVTLWINAPRSEDTMLFYRDNKSLTTYKRKFVPH